MKNLVGFSLKVNWGCLHYFYLLDWGLHSGSVRSRRYRWHSRPPLWLNLAVMLLMLQMNHIQLLFCFFELVPEPGDLLLVRGLILLQLSLKQGEFLHRFLHPLLVLVKHHLAGSSSQKYYLVSDSNDSLMFSNSTTFFWKSWNFVWKSFFSFLMC